MKKGSTGSQVITVLSNYGSSGSSYTLSLSGSGPSSGTQLMEMYTFTAITVDPCDNIAMMSGLPRVLMLAPSAASSGPCASSRATTTATGGCAQATALPVLFKETVTTSYGQHIYISGSISELGNWNTNNAVALSADQYTSSNPVWYAAVTIPVGTSFEYKFIEETDGSTTVTLESEFQQVLRCANGLCWDNRESDRNMEIVSQTRLLSFNDIAGN